MIIGIGGVSIPKLCQASNKPWTPKAVSTSIWLDAADSTTITLNGSNVSQWSDKSGNSRHISQGTAASQPTYAATGLNGQGLITFDGSNDILLNASVGANGINNFTIISVFRLITGTGDDIPICIGETNAVGGCRGFYRNTGGTTMSFGGWQYDVVGSAYSYDIGGDHHIFGLANPKLARPDNAILMRDGLTTTYSTSGGDLVAATNGFSVGSLRGTLVSSFYTNMSVAEIVVFYSTITTEVRQKLEGYLAWKWGLQSKLPAGHPYKDSPPTL